MFDDNENKTKQRHSQQYKTETLALARKVGVPTESAKQLGLHESRLYSWRSKARLAQDRSAVEERLLVEKCLPQAPAGRAGRRVGHRKKGRSVLRQEPEVKYAFMHNNSDEYKITSMSRVLGVSRSWFYRWRQRGEQPTKRQQQRMALDKLVAHAFVARKMRVGSPNLVLDLYDQGHSL